MPEPGGLLLSLQDSGKWDSRALTLKGRLLMFVENTLFVSSARTAWESLIPMLALTVHSSAENLIKVVFLYFLNPAPSVRR